MFKSGFVSIIGRPNVGKSTLLNQILGTKIAIMSDKAQTTRNTLQGIYTDEEAQIIFIDTPGIHKPQDLLGSFMNTTAINSVLGVDIILFMTSCDQEIGKGDRYILNRLKDQEAAVFLVLNKIDTISKEKLIEQLVIWQNEFNFKEIIPISSLKNQNVDQLLSTIKEYLNEGKAYYDANQITDHPTRFIIAEFIREKILFFTHQEIPHSIAIVIDKYEDKQDGVDIIASIIVNRKSQKGMLIGKQGAMIKKIRIAAKKEIKRFLNCEVSLELYVKVEKDWRTKQRYLKQFGYDEDEY